MFIHRSQFRIFWLAAVFAIVALPVYAATTVHLASGLSRPVYVTALPGDFSRIFIVEQWTARIKIYRFNPGVVLAAPFLNIDSLVINSGNERGLLGMAFHPQYAQNRYFFVYYINNGGNSVVARYQASSTNPDSTLPESGQIVLTVPQPPTFSNHKAGMISFGPDGNLYIGFGDGGDAGDPGNRAQSDTTLLGKMLRIDVNTLPYTIPPGNPFAGPDGIRNEIWAKGLRNPWRWSFDRLTGAMYIADVGQGAWEEVDYQPAAFAGGANYGWRLMEGTHCYNPATNCDPGGLTYPIHEFSHTNGCSITGGYVYRGCALPAFQGLYFFADYCSDSIWTFRYDGSTVSDLTNRTTELAPGGGLAIGDISSFGEDAYGELYLSDLLGGEVFKIVPASLSDTNHNSIADECECREGRVTDLVIRPVMGGVQLSWTAVSPIAHNLYRCPELDAPFPGGTWTLRAAHLIGATMYLDPDTTLERAAYVVTADCP